MAFSHCPCLTGFNADGDSPYFTNDEQGILYDKKLTKLIAVPGTVVRCVIPDGVRVIGRDAFSDCENLINVTIPEGVETIENYAFWMCTDLSSIDLPASLSTVEYCAFGGCLSLPAIHVDGNNLYFINDSKGVSLHIGYA